MNNLGMCLVSALLELEEKIEKEESKAKALKDNREYAIAEIDREIGFQEFMVKETKKRYEKRIIMLKEEIEKQKQLEKVGK